MSQSNRSEREIPAGSKKVVLLAFTSIVTTVLVCSFFILRPLRTSYRMHPPLVRLKQYLRIQRGLVRGRSCQSMVPKTKPFRMD